MRYQESKLMVMSQNQINTRMYNLPRISTFLFASNIPIKLKNLHKKTRNEKDEIVNISTTLTIQLSKQRESIIIFDKYYLSHLLFYCHLILLNKIHHLARYKSLYKLKYCIKHKITCSISSINLWCEYSNVWQFKM